MIHTTLFTNHKCHQVVNEVRDVSVEFQRVITYKT